MPPPTRRYTRFVWRSLLGAVIGCSDQPRDLAGTIWQVEDIDQAGIIDNFFDDDGRQRLKLIEIESDPTLDSGQPR